MGIKKLRLPFLLINFLIFLCCNSATKKENDSRLLRYGRHYMSKDSDTTFSDIVAITNYRNNTYSIYSFVEMAKKYADTAKGIHPVEIITFMGQRPEEHLLHEDKYHYEEQKKRFLVAVGFDLKYVDTSNIGIRVNYIELYSDGKTIFSWMELDMKDRRQFDSVINIKTPYDSEF